MMTVAEIHPDLDQIAALLAERFALLSALFDREAAEADRWYGGQVQEARRWTQ